MPERRVEVVVPCGRVSPAGWCTDGGACSDDCPGHTVTATLAPGSRDALALDFADKLLAAMRANPHLVLEWRDEGPNSEMVATTVRRFPAEELAAIAAFAALRAHDAQEGTDDGK